MHFFCIEVNVSGCFSARYSVTLGGCRHLRQSIVLTRERNDINIREIYLFVWYRVPFMWMWMKKASSSIVSSIRSVFSSLAIEKENSFISSHSSDGWPVKDISSRRCFRSQCIFSSNAFPQAVWIFSRLNSDKLSFACTFLNFC